ncbi:hypothetical protein MSAN_00734800 [Mycena sanguinolenta]|uniref:Wings apart-like protein C-terminal domain-containing protein n=1 Tax=Mycena sanguinolenta TaxID=230812 RepID=A0A8H7DGX6_9AGAR|nr:hypothetical protein MSAN_00734800 [Mycena sanguinolenta]
MPSTSFNSRTYSRRSAKRKPESIRQPTPEAKRRKIDQDSEQEGSTDVEEDAPPSRPPRDLSQIFEAVNSPSSSSPEKSPGKLAKRMLSRSRTESSIASGSGSGGGSKNSSTSSVMSRTTSLPGTSKPPNPLASPTKPTNSETTPSPIPRPKLSARTYAGSSRSFLVPIPVNPASLEQLQEELDDEFASRESYTSMRTRWGVDESEDDPYAYGSPRHSGSNVSTPNGSPSKKGKGKGKAPPEPVVFANGMMNPLKSITELRNQGESRRFLDEVGYLWEGLDKSGGLGLRRASALEIATKLCESEFARKAKAADFIAPTWDLLRTAGGGQGEDTASVLGFWWSSNLTSRQIMDILLAFFAALVSRDPATISELAQRSASSFTSTLFSLLQTSSPSTDPLLCTSDAAQLRKLGFSKKDQYLLTTIHTAICNSSLFPDSTVLSISLLTSHTLVSLPSSTLIPTPANMKALLSTLKSHLSPLIATPLSAFIITSLYNDPHVAILHIHNVLSLFDTYLLAGWAPLAEDDIPANRQELEDARDTWLPEGLLALGVYIEAAGSSRNGLTNDKMRECSLVTLRLLVGLTHSDEVWCARLIKSEFCFGFILRAILRGHSTRVGKVKEEPEAHGKVKRESSNGNGRALGKHIGKRPVKVEVDTDEESDAAKKTDSAEDALDTLCLALGFLTNLIQVNDEVKNTLRETYVSPHCTLPKCLTTCKCVQQLSALEALAHVYRELLPVPAPNVKRESSPEPTDPSILLAAEESQLLLSHLSLLFGLLMLDNSENQAAILALLPPPATPSSSYAGDSAKVDVLVRQAREFVYIYSGGRTAMPPRKGRV